MTSSLRHLKTACFALVLAGNAAVLGAAGINDTTQARQYMDMAVAQFNRSNFDSAAVCYRRAGDLWKSSNAVEFVSSQIGIVNSLLRKGEYSSALGILSFADSIGLAGGYSNSALQGSLLILRGYSHFVRGEYLNAESSVRLGIDILTKNLGEDHERVGSALYTMGVVYKVRGEYPEAIAALERALHIQRTRTASGRIYIANTVMMLGSIYDDMNEFDRAIGYFLQADTIYRAIGQEYSADAGACYLQLMSSYYNKWDLTAAIETGKKVVDIFTRLGLKGHINLGNTYMRMGEVYISLGDLEKSKEYLFLALAVYTADPSLKRFSTGRTYVHLADAYSREGNMNDAVLSLEKGIPLYEETVGDSYPQSGFVYETAGRVYAAAKKFDKAELYFKKALDARNLVANRRSGGDLAMLHLSLGQVFRMRGADDSAMVYLRKAWAIDSASSESNVRQKAQLLHGFGEWYEGRKMYGRALEYYHRALQNLLMVGANDDVRTVPAVDETMYKNELLELLVAKARVFERRSKSTRGNDDLVAAFEHYRIAMDVLDDTRKGFSSDASKLNLAHSGASLYRSGCRIALQLFDRTNDPKFTEAAFLIADRSKGNVLLERLFENEARHFSGIPDSLIRQEHELLSGISKIETQLSREPGTEKRIMFAALDGERTRYYRLKQQHQDFIEMLERQYPKYFDLKYAGSAMTLNTLQERLDERTVLIEYMVDENAVYAFVVTKKNLSVRTLKNSEHIRTLSQKFTHSLKTYDSQEFCTAGDELYSLLLRPLEAAFFGATELKIVPDGFLYYFPFEALPVQRYSAVKTGFASMRYLISDFNVSYAYSAALHDKLNTHSGTTGHGPSSFVGFAPVFKDSAKNGDFFANRDAVKQSGLSDARSITLDGKTFNELRFSEDEVAGIEATMAGNSIPSQTFLFEAASEENFKEYAPKYDIVHVATHGFINESNPKFSAVIFSQPRSVTGREDGILYVNETFNLKLNAKLVVLSSCESGVGKLVEGEGMIALSRGLFYAGAQNLIFSLWKISDKQTYRLMDELYKNIAAGKPFASALRNAKLSMLKSPETAFPAKWSGFILVGQ